jgi:hypothetical protein
MISITDGKGNKLVVVATLPDGIKIAIDTKEKLEAFFAQHPHAQLEFVTEGK